MSPPEWWQCAPRAADTVFLAPSLPWQNLNGVMVAVAELLSMKIPNSYEVLFPESPARPGTEPKKGEAEGPGECGRKSQDLQGGMLLGGSDPFLSVGGKEKGLGGKSPEAGPDWLKQFDAVLPGYTLKSQLDILSLLKQVGVGEKRGWVCGEHRRQRALGRVDPG